jgi:hypothetical protein
MDTTGYHQVISWSGSDRDGYVVGYEYAWNDTSPGRWTWTEATCETFDLEIADTVITYTFYVRAQDNEGARDPSPSWLSIPATNSRPQIAFRNDTEPPETTLTTATFYWEATDPDGDQTIEAFLYRTDSQSAWDTLSPDSDHVTIRNLVPGNRTFFLKALDEAHATSDSVSYSWYVLETAGDLLLIDDFDDATADGFYPHVLDSLGIPYTHWSISSGLPYSYDDVYDNINNQGFRTILWYSGIQSQIERAQPALTHFLGAGHNLFLGGPGFLAWGDLPSFFSEEMYVDTLLKEISLVFTGTRLRGASGYPDVGVSLPIQKADGCSTRIGGEQIYHLEANGGWWPYCHVGIRYPLGGPARRVYLSFDLSRSDGDGNAAEVLAKILREEFGY